MEDKDRELIQAQINMDRWAQTKHWVTEGLCIGCGGTPDLKLYVHFCNQCLLEAGVSVEFLPLVDVAETEEAPAKVENDGEWLRFIETITRESDGLEQ